MYTNIVSNSYLGSPSRVSISEVLLSYIFCDNTYNAPCSYRISPSLVYLGGTILAEFLHQQFMLRVFLICLTYIFSENIDNALNFWGIFLSVVTLTLVAHRLPMKPGSHWQLKLPWVLTQVAPFRHGSCSVHSLMSSIQLLVLVHPETATKRSKDSRLFSMNPQLDVTGMRYFYTAK